MARQNDPVLIVGLGRFGTSLAVQLFKGGTSVLAIDADMRVVQRVSGLIEHVMAADCTDVESLRQAGAADFRRAVVAIGSDQEASILAVAALDEIGVPDIWAKALTQRHERILRKVGAHHVVLPEHDMGQRVAHLVQGRMSDYIEVTSDWVMARTKPPRYLVGVPLGDSGLRTSRRITVVAVRPGSSERFTHADMGTVLDGDDDIMVMGMPADVEAFAES